MIIQNMAGAGKPELFSDKGVKTNQELMDYLESLGLAIEVLKASSKAHTDEINDLDRQILVVKKVISNPGGIDLNNLNMQTSGQASQIQMPTDPAMLNQPIKMLVPQIIHIGEVNLGIFLGLNTDPQDSDPTASPSPELAAIKEET